MAINNPSNAVAGLNLPNEPQLNTVDIVKFIDDRSGNRLSSHIHDALATFAVALQTQSDRFKKDKSTLFDNLVDAKKLKNVKTVLDTSLKFITDTFQSTNGKVIQWHTDIENALDSSSTAFANFNRSTNDSLLKLSVTFNDRIRNKLESAILNYDPSAVLNAVTEPTVADTKTRKSSIAKLPTADKKTPMPVSLVSVDANILRQFKVEQPNQDLTAKKEQQFEGMGLAIRTFGKPAYAQLKSLLKGEGRGSPLSGGIDKLQITPRRTRSKGTDLWDLVFSGLGAALKGGLGVWLLKSAWDSGDAFRTLKKVAGKWLLQPLENFFKPLLKGVAEFGSKVAEKAFGKAGLKSMASIAAKAGKMLSKTLRFVPFVGTLVNIGFGLQRLQKGDLNGGLLEIGAGLAGLVPVVGTALDWGINAFLLWRDYKEGGVDQIGKKAGSINWLDKIGKELEKLTLVKGLVLAGKGIGKITDGSIGKGLADIVVGLSMIGAGTLTSAFEAIGLITQMQDVRSPSTTKGGSSGKSLMDMLADQFKHTAIYKWLSKFGDAVSQIWSGKVFSGIGQIVTLIGDANSDIAKWVVVGMQDFAAEFQAEGLNATASTVAHHGGWFMQLVSWFKQTSFGKFVGELGKGFEMFNQGKLADGLRQMANTFGGAFGSALIAVSAWGDAATADAMETVTGKPFDIKQFRSQIADRMFAILPTSVRNMFEIDANGNAQLKSTKQIIDSLIPDSVKKATTTAKNAVSSMMPSWMSKGPDSANDLVVTSSESKPIKLNRDDQLMAGKKGGPLDKLIDRATTSNNGSIQPVVIQLSKSIEDLNKTYKQSSTDMREMLSDAIQQQTVLYLSGVQQIVNAVAAAVGNNSGGAQGGDSGGADQSAWTGSRDPAYIQRLNSWNMINPPSRMAP